MLFKQFRSQQLRQLLQPVHQARAGAADEVVVEGVKYYRSPPRGWFPTRTSLYRFRSRTPYRVAEDDDGGIGGYDLFDADLRIRVAGDIADIVSAGTFDQQGTKGAGPYVHGFAGSVASTS